MQLPQLLAILLERMRNDITRLAAVRGFATIASAPTTVDLSTVRAWVESWVGRWLWSEVCPGSWALGACAVFACSM
jgi:hypothetical protein